MRKAYLTSVLVALALGIFALACDISSFLPAPTLTPTPSATPTSVPVSHDGLWDGSVSSDATFSGAIQFLIENSQLTELTFNYTLRSGGCTEQVVTSGTFDETKMTGNNFTARAGDSNDKRQLIITGTFASATEMNGTLEFRGAMEGCGNFNKIAKLSARSIPPRPTRTPTLPPPTVTPTRPTATRAPATPGGASTPSGWVTLRSVRFAISVPPSFESQVALRDVRLNPGSAQLILMGEDRETGLKVEMTETPALFGNAQKKMENRKSDLSYFREPTLLLKAETGITVNGRDAAILEYTRGGLSAVECFIVAGQEEFDIVIQQGKANDANFIASAERIANSFRVDTTATLVTPTAVKVGTPPSSQATEIVKAFFTAINARDLDTAFQSVDDSAMAQIGNSTTYLNKANLRSYFQSQIVVGTQYSLSNFEDVGGVGVTFNLKMNPTSALTTGAAILNEKNKIIAFVVQ